MIPAKTAGPIEMLTGGQTHAVLTDGGSNRCTLAPPGKYDGLIGAAAVRTVAKIAVGTCYISSFVF